jgi:ribosomal protein S18 acetylase RimI-like enzyme
VISLETQLAANRGYLLGWNAGDPGEADPLTYRSGVPHAPLNGVLRVRQRSLTDAYAVARARLDNVPRVWWAGPDSAPGAADGLLDLGAAEITSLPIMEVDIDRVPAVPTPPVLHIAEAADLGEFVTAYAQVSGIPKAGVGAAIEREKAGIWDGTVVRLAGRVEDGRIAATSVAWFSHGLVTIYFVGTQPAYRRRGFGAAMTRAALEAARDRGVRTASLVSSHQGEPLYARLGFREAGRYRLLSF